ncbi:hypothetical protein INQ51_04705 [Maribellus sp. CM-23]|uniref:hypothetical protein n=1 Tax=Maribellus sp. CM-23 TaxID=2781026 RepID=UPI001F30B620|nr:hypothetical protein [Maribellus sp. CM-23]MCE4563601.1 hypothetical protein [Maribellus sp. CM-23]
MDAKRSLIFIVPLLYACLGIYIQQLTGLYSLRSIDPEYIYYISGLSVANGHLQLGHIDNPGTPLQYFLALAFRAIYLFRSHEVPFIEDALAHPDFYLNVAHLFFVALMGGFIYFAGTKAYKKTKSVTTSILVQTIPFYTITFYGNLGRITPENFIPIPIILLTLRLLSETKKESGQSSWQETFQYAAITALGLSIKLTFLPLALIPFIIIRSWKKKIAFSFSTLGLFFAFALPATLQIKRFWNWTKTLFFHSGQYGSGEEGILDFQKMLPNLQKVWENNQLFVILSGGMLITLVLYTFLKKKEDSSIPQRIAIAIIAAIFAQFLMMSKNYEQRYFIAPLLIPLIVLLSLKLTQAWQLRLKGINSYPLVILLFLFFYTSTQVPIIRSLSKHLDNEKVKKMPAYYHFQSFEKDAIKVLVPGYYNCPSPAYALRFSYGWAGKQKEIYKPYLGKLFPNTVIYYFWDGTFNSWIDDFKLTTEKPIHIYLEHIKHLDTIKEVLEKHISKEFELEQTFYNEASNEAFYSVKYLINE